MTAPEPATVAAPEHVDTPWQRLNPRMIVVRPLHDAVGLIPVLVLYLVVGSGDTLKLVLSLAAIGLLLLFGFAHWALTKYRITDQQVQLHTGLIQRKQLAVRTDRIRTVETTAKFGHRLFGLTALRIGTGHQVKEHDGELKLDAVTAAEAHRLHALLLRRKENTPTAAPEPTQSTVDSPVEDVLATTRPSWLRFAPLTLSGLAAVAAGVGILFRAANDLQISPDSIGVIRWTLRTAEHTSIVVDALAVLAVIVVIVVVGGLIGYVLQFWNYRLTREPDHSLRVRRGLLTARSVTVDGARLRGVRIREPLLLRLAAGARTDVISTGISRKDESTLLVPPAPRREANAIAATVLATPAKPPATPATAAPATPATTPPTAPPAHLAAPADSPTAAALRRHPVSALRRRLVRAIAVAVVLVLAFFVTTVLGWLPSWTWQLALLLIPLAALLGWDRYRSLGHTISGRYLVTRSGSLPRDTAALQRTGIIGWTVRSSLFQRRAGLVTVTATTAAGSGAYHVIDVAAADGVALADAATPGLLTPFLTGTGYPHQGERPAGVDRLRDDRSRPAR